MTITIEVPDIKLSEFELYELLFKAGKISDEFKDYWTHKFTFIDNIYTLTLEGVVDGELVEETFSATSEEVCKYMLETINHFEYEGRYGTRMELTHRDQPSFSLYRREGTLKSFLEETIKDALSGTGYSYGYCE